MIEAAQRNISKKEVRNKPPNNTDRISKTKEHQNIRQLSKLIGIAKRLLMEVNSNLRDSLQLYTKNLQEIGKVTIRQ